MTMRRQYQLPNCSLILDGLSIDPSPGREDIMSLLVNAECRISGLERSLNGGYNFFAALVRAVSQYSQEVLSGYAHPQVIEGEPLLVHINPGDGPYHHLVVQPEIADLGELGDGRAIDIKLSAVQLFDLTEAVDQFFDDRQTLPELEPGLSPLAKRFVRSEEPLSDRAVPAVLGVGTLVAATMVLGLFPTPKLVEPAAETLRGEQSAEVISTDGSEGESSGEPPTDETDPDEVSSVPSTGDTSEAADAGVGVDEDPLEQAVAALDDVDAIEADVATTSRVSEEDSDVASGTADSEFERFNEFKVETASEAEVDTSTGDITTANATTFGDGPPTSTSSFATVRSLNDQLKQTIVENREQPRFGEAVSYRVRVDEDGTVLGYEPINSLSEDAISETPLPRLVKGSAATEPAVDYRVVFTERGVVEVSPWWGWSYYD